MSTSIVRRATQSDEEALFDFALDLHRRDRLGRSIPYDYAKVQAAIEHGTRNKGSIIGVIDAPDRSGYIAGSVNLLLDEWYWAKVGFMQMRWIFVRPRYRKGTGYGDALMVFAEEMRLYFEKSQPPGYPPVVFEMSFVESDLRQLQLKERWFARFGRKIGAIYVSGL